MIYNIKMEKMDEWLDKLVIDVMNSVYKSAGDMAKQHQKDLAIAIRNELMDNQHLLKSLKIQNPQAGQYEVQMSKTGQYVDSMSPHLVWAGASRPMYKWAMEYGDERIKAIAKRHGMIFVKPHPFIREAQSQSLIKFDEILKSNIRRAIENV
jgi:hypothetical protein